VPGSDAALVGTAVGYVLNAVLRENALDRTPALKGVRILELAMRSDLPAQAERAAVTRVRELAPSVRSLSNAEWVELLGLAVVLSRLEQAGRAPLSRIALTRLHDRFKTLEDKGLAELVRAFAAGPETFSDLDALARATVEDWGTLRHADRLVIGPSFAEIVSPGWAEGDLLADGTLLELKSTPKPSIADRYTLLQILGYVLSDTCDAYGIQSCTRVALRRRNAYNWSVQELLDGLAGGPTRSVDFWRREFAPLLPRQRAPSPGAAELGEESSAVCDPVRGRPSDTSKGPRSRLP
jgi:hypothetical protein